MGFLFGKDKSVGDMLFPNPIPGVPRKISDPIGYSLGLGKEKKPPPEVAQAAAAPAAVLYPSDKPQDADENKSLLGE